MEIMMVGLLSELRISIISNNKRRKIAFKSIRILIVSYKKIISI